MLLLLSPAKSLDFSKPSTNKHTQGALIEKSKQLTEQMRTWKKEDIQSLMKVSEKLANLNVERNQQFVWPHTIENAKQALLAFDGGVYKGLAVETFTEEDLAFAQDHIGILSGLYGFLRPLDLIQPYRLEMGTKMVMGDHKNLYEFWANQITDVINKQNPSAIVNLASKEYFKSVKDKNLTSDLWNVAFKEFRKGKYKIIAFSAKKARGMMCHYVVKNRLTKPEEMKGFDMEDYQFNEELSSERELVFTR